MRLVGSRRMIMSISCVRSCLGFSLALTLGIMGCGPTVELPKTYPVKGKVTVKGSNQALGGGSIEFINTNGQGPNALGDLGTDGTFELRTTVAQAKESLKGAVEGTFKVKITPPMGADQQIFPYDVPKTAKVEAKDLNEFTFEYVKP